MIAYPLTRANRLRVAQVFANVPHVDISIECVLEDQMGKVFVDSTENPHYFLIEQDSFFCYLAGDFSTDAGRTFLSKLPRGRFLMAGSQGWDVVQDVYGDGIMPIPRHHYSSDTLAREHLQTLAQNNPNTPNIKRIDPALISKGIPFLEIGAFESQKDFLERGVGFIVMQNEQSIGVAYSSLVASNALEVSIVVDEAHRRKGIATALSCQLLLWCLERSIAPHWDAANDESCALAEKLGYSDKQAYTAYFLKPE